jgi:hypothetical protein
MVIKLDVQWATAVAWTLQKEKNLMSLSGIETRFLGYPARISDAIPKPKSCYNWRSISVSRCQAHSETCDQILLSVWRLLSESCCLVSVGRPLWREAGFVICPQSVVIYQYLHQAFTLNVFYSSAIYVQASFRPVSVQQIMLCYLLWAHATAVV